MRNQMLCRAIAITLLLVSGLATGSGRAESPQLNNWLRISAFTDHPLAGADVAVFSKDGGLLFEKTNATNARGIYPVKLMNLPKEFCVVVTDVDPNASSRFNLGQVVLSADVRNYNPVRDVVYVNPVTTLVTGLLLRRPDFSLQQAQARVRRFLAMPANASLGAALRETQQFRSDYFSESTFLNQANEHGGELYFEEDLVNQMLDNPRATHPFSSTAQIGPKSIANFIATNLAAGALEWVEGQGLGWVAQSAGLTTPGATAAQVMQLQQSLESLQSSVDQLSKQLEQATQQILNELTKTQYLIIAQPALGLASDVNVVEQNLDYYVQGCPPLPGDGTLESAGAIPAGWCAAQGALVSSQLSDIRINGSYENLSKSLLDNPTLGIKGMIHLFSQSAGQSVRFFRPADSTRVQNMFDYWEAVETQAANLKVELWHLNDAQNNPGGRKQLTDFLGNPELKPPTTGAFQATNADELQLMFPAVPVGAVVDTKTLLMWLTDIPKFPPEGYCPYLTSPLAGTYGFSQGPSFGVSYKGLSWKSPNLSQMQGLIDGWSGKASTPMDWLIAQSKAVRPDSPTSSGFFNIIICNNLGPYSYVWTTTDQGSSGSKYSVYALMDMRNGSVPAKNTAPYKIDTIFDGQYLMLTRGLAPGEQYYWYP
jgi:hypothetical protein